MRKFLIVLAGLAVMQAAPAEAGVTRDNFLLRNSGDLAALCGVAKDDPNAAAAIHFCHGYVLGLSHFNIAVGRIFEGKLYCYDQQNKRPSRDEAIANFVKWSKANPKNNSVSAFDGVLKWAAANYPCKK